ncbi:unnamed protein product [Adineta steineri]|uniref:Uncharacterized protein n=1 Tax=Adineta steineri TaxID=433720 RepID=A0A818ZCW0_9BILA|nr:unnamed protein product [Adineta steineri]
MPKMFSGRGYCTQPTCFPVLGAPPIAVFLCNTHCGHMLCYRHWLSHQTTIADDDKKEMEHSSSTVTLDSDLDEQEAVPDLLRECTNQEEHYTPDKNFNHSFELSENTDPNEKKEKIESNVYAKEIEWWNEITPWKNSEDFYTKIMRHSTDEDFDYSELYNRNDDSDYEIKGKRKISKKRFEQSISCRSYSDECPLTFDGAFGLIQEYHQHSLCTKSRNSNKKICLYQHFNSKHGFTRQISIRLVKAIIEHKDPKKTKLFSLTNDTPSNLFDPYHKVKCPFSTRSDLINTPCLTQEITRKSFRRHLSGVHRLDQQTINKLMKEMIK